MVVFINKNGENNIGVRVIVMITCDGLTCFIFYLRRIIF